MKNSEVLEAAAQYHAEHGSCKGSYRTEDGRVCLLGAIHAVLGVDSSDLDVTFDYAWQRNQFREVTDIVRYQLLDDVEDFDGDFVHLYNDREDVSGEDVTLLLKRSAELAREEEKDDDEEE